MSTANVPRPAQLHNTDHSNALVLFIIAAATVVAFPASVVGALVTWAGWRAIKPDTLTQWLLAAVGTATVATLHSDLVFAWLFRLLLQPWQPSLTAGLTPQDVSQSLPVETLMGPTLLVVARFGNTLRRQTIHGQEWERYRSVTSRKKALERHWPGPTVSSTSEGAAGVVRLGLDTSAGHAFDLDPRELAQHVFIPGASGTGKTTTIVTLADGVLSQGYGVVFVDFKGSALGREARNLAERHKLPFRFVDPFDMATDGYNPCSGEPAAVANKLIGSFTFSGEAEIYKQVAMEVIPIVCRALGAAGDQVTLATIYEALRPGGLTRLARKLRVGHDALRVRLEDLDDPRGVGGAGLVGLQRRLGALMEGAFGEVFRKNPPLNLADVTRTPAVTYFSLSATAAGEDVELFGRVILQDLKQLCADRMRAAGNQQLFPVLLVLDEFAALREATQVVDLLLQAREAQTPIVVATQFLPEEVSIRRPVMSAGVLIVHRLEAEDAEMMAAQFGTHTVPMLTAQVDYLTGTSEKGSVRWVEEFNVHPNDLKELPTGTTAVYARPTRRRAIVRVNKTD
jgi:hypothetical protein